MTMVSTFYKMPLNDQNLWTQRLIKQGEGGGFIREYHSIQVGCRRLPSYFPATDILTKTSKRGVVPKASVPWKACHAQNGLRPISDNASQKENFPIVWFASESSTVKKQLRSLDSYFGKLQNKENCTYADSSNKTELIDFSGESKLKKGLGSLEDYLSKLNKDANSEWYLPSNFIEETTEGKPELEGPLSMRKDSQRGYEDKRKSYVEFVRAIGPKSSHVPQQYDETSDFYLIGILASINIAVFLFEIASPIRNSELEVFTLPLIYGAKINDLILIGEWWRLVTPMFLHSGILHVALSCWSLLTFAPQVCKSYGSFTFFLIYILGGISGNLISFFHTPEPTVGGTGPVFALVGAWLIYQFQNKDVISKDVSDSMFQKAVLTTALGFILSALGPIDDWTHFGAAFTGIVYGFFTCPALQVDDGSSKSTGQEEGITLVRRDVNPCRSLLVFTILIGVLSSSLFFIEPPLSMLVSESLR